LKFDTKEPAVFPMSFTWGDCRSCSPSRRRRNKIQKVEKEKRKRKKEKKKKKINRKKEKKKKKEKEKEKKGPPLRDKSLTFRWVLRAIL